VRLTVNGVAVEVAAGVERVLLDVLRDDIGLTGTKADCGMGVCGTCTVLVDGRPASSCLLLACLVDGRDVVTIEGLGRGGVLDAVQTAFAEVGAFECGFCTAGMILTARALLDANPHPRREEIVEFMSGNLCRCTGYADILRAIELAAERSDAARGAGPDPRP
jgi:aerobic-type carbon monoxide dehydrogenase small subunit (CoxS/CutS family)